MGQKNLMLYGDTDGTIASNTTNVASTLVCRDADKSVNVGQVNCTAVVNTGTATLAIGVSTAAAGSTTTDAGVLPAGTAECYPTTSADGTKGVRIHTSDKVDGRRILIGNGVSTAILKIYAPAGGSINGAAADAAYSTASGKGATVVCLSASSNTWLAWG